jgi:pilus assembly protein Flp/PilA
MKKMAKWIRKQQEGATMVEYGIMVALIAAISIVVVGLLGVQVQAAFQIIVDALTPAVP